MIANSLRILVTAKADRRAIRIAMQLGADGYLTKPGDKPDLLGAICSRLAQGHALARDAA